MDQFPLVEVSKINITRWQMFQLGLWAGLGMWVAGVLSAVFTFGTEAVIFLARSSI